MPRLIYSEFSPIPELAGFVDSLWTVYVDSAGTGQPVHWVIPDACATLAIGLRPALYVRIRKPSLVPLRAPCTPGEHIVGLRFAPGVRTPDILGTLRAMLTVGMEAGEVLAAAQAIVLNRRPTDDPRVAEIVARVRASAGQCRMRQVASDLGVSARQLERLAGSSIGLAPKDFAQVTRVQCTIRRTIAEPHWALADLAAASGYVDQTHMTREFRSIAGLTPAAYRSMIRDVAFVL